MDRYQRIDHREIYRNPWLRVEVHDVVHPTGAEGEHVLICTPRASAVVIADEDDLIFARQPRFAADAETVELVKGGAHGDETALECAQRETREELGIEAERWQYLGALYEIPSIVDNPVELFLATQIYHVDTEAERVEQIELVRMPRDVAFAAAASGRLHDAITVAGLFRYGFFTGCLTTAPVDASRVPTSTPAP